MQFNLLLPKAVVTWLTLFCLSLSAVEAEAAASPEVPRIAILGEGESRDLADVLLAEMSLQPGIEVVERTQLDKLAEEKGILSLVGTDRTMTLAKFARANAVLIVEKQQTGGGNQVAAVRLVTVPDGVVRRLVWLPWLPQETAINSRLAVEQMRESVKSVLHSAAVPSRRLSLLGFRGEVNAPGIVDAESRLNALLAHRLASLPGMVVLERWRMNDLAFESQSGAEGYVAGSQLVQGSMKMQGDVVHVRMIVKLSEADPGVVAELNGQLSKLGELADAMAERISGLKTGTLPPWKPEEEAGRYGRLGAWLLEHGLAYPAAQAFESAVALGDRSPSNLVGRAEAWAMTAFPAQRRVSTASNQGFSPNQRLSERLDLHLVAATYAANYAADWIDQAHPSEVPTSNEPNDAAIVGQHVFFSALKCLRIIRESAKDRTFQNETNNLRVALFRLVKAVDGTWMRLSPPYLAYKASYAAYWTPSMDEALAYYRLVLSPDFASSKEPDRQLGIQVYMRNQLFHGVKHAPMLDVSDSVLKPSRFPQFNIGGTERLIDWEGGNLEKVRLKWSQFIAELRAASSPQSKADAIGFEMGASYLASSQQKLLEQAVALLWQHRSILVGRDGERMMAAFGELTPNNFGVTVGQTPGALLELRRLYQDLFEKEQWVPQFMMLSMRHLQAWPGLKNGEMMSLFDAMEGYRKRAEADARWGEMNPFRRNTTAEIFDKTLHNLKDWSGLAAELSKPGEKRPLQVVRFWNPNRSNGGVELKNGEIYSNGLALERGRLWVTHRNAGLISVDADTLATRVWGAPATGTTYKGKFYEMLIGPDSLLAVDGLSIWNFAFQTRSWTRLPLPEIKYRLHSLTGGAAFSFGSTWGEPSSGAGAGWMKGGDVHWAFSTRRRPVEHPFDEATVEEMKSVFSGPGGAPWVAWREGKSARVQPLSPDAGKVMKFNTGLEVASSGDRTLLLENMNISGRVPRLVQAWCVRSDRAAPQLLVHHPQFFNAPEGTTAVWQLPEWMKSGNAQGYVDWRPFLRGDQLWILQQIRAEMSSRVANYSLIAFLPGKKDPVELTLRFVSDPEDCRTTGVSAEKIENPDCRANGFVWSSYGLAFSGAGCPGVWLISWQEIDRFMAGRSSK